MAFSLFSPAKINRMLQIIGRRHDGYHLLQTVFQFIDLCDHLHFQNDPDGKIVILTDHAIHVLPEHNIIYKAAMALREAVSMPSLGAVIRLDKRIPLGAGLGGGSSNAATTLMGLNRLWGLELSKAQLLKIGARLGADVSIFIFGHSAWGEGIGEMLTFVELDEPWVVLLSPECIVETPKMYADPELTRNSSPFKIGSLTKEEIKSIVRTGKNDFETVVCRQFPEVVRAMKWLSNFGKPQLSGSGASVFACFEDETSARNVVKMLPASLKGSVFRAMNQSPLFLELA